VRSLLLKAAATALTLGAAAGAAMHVGGHVRDASAPLHPVVLGPPAATTTTAGGRLQLTPSVRSSTAQPVTFTAAS